MADNTELNAGTGGDIVASDDISGVKHQRVKVEFGANGSATDVSPESGLPTAPAEKVLTGSVTAPVDEGDLGSHLFTAVDTQGFTSFSVSLELDEDGGFLEAGSNTLYVVGSNSSDTPPEEASNVQLVVLSGPDGLAYATSGIEGGSFNGGAFFGSIPFRYLWFLVNSNFGSGTVTGKLRLTSAPLPEFQYQATNVIIGEQPINVTFAETTRFDYFVDSSSVSSPLVEAPAGGPYLMYVGNNGTGGTFKLTTFAGDLEVKNLLTGATVTDVPTMDGGQYLVDYIPYTPASVLNGANITGGQAIVSFIPLRQAPASDGGGSVTVSNFPSTQPVSGTVAVSNLPGTQPVSGTVNVGNFPSAQPVTDNGGSLTVDGTVAVSNFPSAQPVTDNGGSLTVDGSVSVSNFPSTQPVSIASPVPVTDNGGSLTVDGTVGISGTVPVSGTVTVSNPGGTVVGTTDNTTGSALVGEAMMGYDTANSVYRRVTASPRGSVNEKMALDVAQSSAVTYVTVSTGSGTRYFGATNTPGTPTTMVDLSTTGAIDALGYSTYTVGVYGTNTPSGTVTLQGSHNGSTWAPLIGEAYAPSGAVSLSSAGVYSGLTNYSTVSGPLVYRYIRVLTSGTQTSALTLQFALTPTSLAKNMMTVFGSEATNTDTGTPLSGVATFAANYGYYGGSGWQRIRTPAVYKTAIATASGSTALWTPTASKKFRLMRYKIDVPNSTIAASAGDLAITFYDAAAAMTITETITVPSAATGGLGAWTSGWVDLGNGIISATANNVLNINLSFALTAGGVRVICCGTEE